MSHPDTSWRVGAIYRSCVRYGMDQETATAHMRAISTDPWEKNRFERCCEIWWRTMERRRQEYKEQDNV